MKNYLFTFFLLLSSLFAYGQATIAELEAELKSTKDRKSKMSLYYQLGEKYMSKDTKKAGEYAREAESIANDSKDYYMVSQANYLYAQSYLARRENKLAIRKLEKSLQYAKLANDYDMIIKSVNKLSDIALKSREYRKAYEGSRSALDYFSKQGYNASKVRALERDLEVEKSKLTKQKRNLEKEKLLLVQDIKSLEKEKSNLVSNQDKLQKHSETLVKEKETIQQEISVKEEEIASIEQLKKQAEYKAKSRQRRISVLSKEAMVDSLEIAEQDASLAKMDLRAARDKNLRNLLLLLSAFVLALAGLFYLRYRAKRKSNIALEEKNNIIEEERKRSDDLLLNILPIDIANELKEKGKVAARKYEEATVLFSDFKNFTSLSERLTPEQLVKELDYCFKAFDLIVQQYGIEKIKTIGDAYMAASGLSNQKALPKHMVQAALEMQTFLENYKKDRQSKSLPFFEARIGIHSGPVVGGVVGVNKYAYDIWGDTVNIASRMESNSEVGKVNISESTYRLVKYNFSCTHRGKIAAKNKGEIDMYYVNPV